MVDRLRKKRQTVASLSIILLTILQWHPLDIKKEEKIKKEERRTLSPCIRYQKISEADREKQKDNKIHIRRK